MLPGHLRDRERYVADGHFEDQDAQRPDVGGRCSRLGVPLFGRHVGGRALDARGGCVLVGGANGHVGFMGEVSPDESRQAEVERANASVCAEQDVGGLQVTVDDEVAMCFAGGFCDGLCDRDPGFGFEGGTFESGTEGVSLDVFESEEGGRFRIFRWRTRSRCRGGSTGR